MKFYEALGLEPKLALDSDDDIRPVGEWPLLRTVALKLQLSHVW